MHDGRTMGAPTCSISSSRRESMRPSGWELMFAEHFDRPGFRPPALQIRFLPSTKQWSPVGRMHNYGHSSKSLLALGAPETLHQTT